MFVTRTAYDALQRECDRWATLYETLLEKYHALRLLNHTAGPIVSERDAVAPPQNDVDLVYHTQRAMALDAAYQDLLAQGLSPDEARGEAARMIDSLFAPVAGEFQ